MNVSQIVRPVVVFHPASWYRYPHRYHLTIFRGLTLLVIATLLLWMLRSLALLVDDDLTVAICVFASLSFTVVRELGTAGGWRPVSHPRPLHC